MRREEFATIGQIRCRIAGLFSRKAARIQLIARVVKSQKRNSRAISVYYQQKEKQEEQSKQVERPKQEEHPKQEEF